MTFERGDIVVVPFPYTDRDAAKRRPALVVSSAAQTEATGNVGLAMITSAKQSSWPFDVPLTDLADAGLPQPCVIRMKLFTLATKLVVGRRGTLNAVDAAAARTALGGYLGIIPDGE